DVLYVEELIGPLTVNTMPEETIQAFQDHGSVAETLEQGLDEARRTFERLEEAGVDYDDVTRTLEREGVEKFADSFSELLEGIRAKSGELVTA
ncbi:MAG: transaldolase family protein, partial [Gaiellaceae bacterium]